MIDKLELIDCKHQGEHLKEQPQEIVEACAVQASYGQESCKAP